LMVAASARRRSASRAGMPKPPMILGGDSAGRKHVGRAPRGHGAGGGFVAVNVDEDDAGGAGCVVVPALARDEVVMSSRGPQARAMNSIPPKTRRDGAGEHQDLHLAPLGLRRHGWRAGLGGRAVGGGQGDLGGQHAFGHPVRRAPRSGRRWRRCRPRPARRCGLWPPRSHAHPSRRRRSRPRTRRRPAGLRPACPALSPGGTGSRRMNWIQPRPLT